MKQSVLGLLAAGLLAAPICASALDFQFSFTNTTGTVPGTVTGRILGLKDNGTSAATHVLIDSFPAGLNSLAGPVPIDAVLWDWQGGENSFTVLNGQIVAGGFWNWQSGCGLLNGLSLFINGAAYYQSNGIDGYNSLSLNGCSGKAVVADKGLAVAHIVPYSTTATPGEKAAALALTAEGAPYTQQFEPYGGAKGWDWYGVSKGYVTTAKVKSDPYYWSYQDSTKYEPGLDCSGLILWSWNKANGGTNFPPEGEIAYSGADGQYQGSTTHFKDVGKDEGDLRAGDLLFFDAEPLRPNAGPICAPGTIDHVAMFLKDGGVIEATMQTRTVRRTTVAERISLKRPDGKAAFCDFASVTTPLIGFAVKTQSPIHLAVIDPEGFTIDHNTVSYTSEERLTEIPGHLYYSPGTNGDDTVYSPKLKPGSYLIKVIPKNGADPTEPYGLLVEAGDTTIVLADGVKVGDAPSEGYGIVVRGTEPAEFLPVRAVVRSGSAGTHVDLKAKGVLPVTLLSSTTFDATKVDGGSVSFGPSHIPEAHAKTHIADVNQDGRLDAVLHFSIPRIGLAKGTQMLELWASTLQGAIVRAAVEVSAK